MLKRGRRPGRGPFTGGRPKGAAQKGRKFDATLPPVNCFTELREWAEAQAQRDGKKLTVWIREHFEALRQSEVGNE